MYYYLKLLEKLYFAYFKVKKENKSNKNTHHNT